jgi:hypothetical protein
VSALPSDARIISRTGGYPGRRPEPTNEARPRRCIWKSWVIRQNWSPCTLGWSAASGKDRNPQGVYYFRCGMPEWKSQIN